MTLTEDFLTQAASDVLGPSREIVAAGVFGVEATYLGKAAGAVVGSLPGELLGGAAGEIVGVGGAVVGMHAADDAEAQKEGVTALVLLALTSESINILDWSKEDATARVLVTLPLASTQVELHKVGFKVSIKLRDPANEVEYRLWGSTASFSKSGSADKVFYEALSRG